MQIKIQAWLLAPHDKLIKDGPNPTILSFIGETEVTMTPDILDAIASPHRRTVFIKLQGMELALRRYDKAANIAVVESYLPDFLFETLKKLLDNGWTAYPVAFDRYHQRTLLDDVMRSRPS